MAQISLIKGNLALQGITSGQVLNALNNKHSNDVFIPECKNGETWGARDLLKLDAWVLIRTYSPLTTIGYEIKVSRSDFENDQKWTGYLDLCHLFYFVCPAGLIRATDLPLSVGLIWVSQSGALHIKRKAERRNPDIEKQSRLLIYALMARSKIVANMFETNRIESNNSVQEGMQERVRIVKEATDKKELAYFVKGNIRTVSEELKKKEEQLRYRENHVKDFEKRLALLGITWDSLKSNWADNAEVGRDIDSLKSRIDEYMLRNMKEVGQRLIDTAEIIAKMHSTRAEGK